MIINIYKYKDMIWIIKWPYNKSYLFGDEKENEARVSFKHKIKYWSQITTFSAHTSMQLYAIINEW